MQSHVVGVIPKFKFAIDTFAEEQHQVREILASKDFDIGQPEPCDEVPIFAKGTCMSLCLLYLNYRYSNSKNGLVGRIYILSALSFYLRSTVILQI